MSIISLNCVKLLFLQMDAQCFCEVRTQMLHNYLNWLLNNLPQKTNNKFSFQGIK
jgi:hypothetical protein